MPALSPLRRLLALLPLLASLGAQAETAVTDQRGVTVPLALPAQRVVFIPPVMWTYLTVDQGSQHLVGTSAFARRVIQQGLLGERYPAAAELPDVTSNGFFAPNVEAILALHPDVIFQTSQIGADAYAPLEQLGLPVLAITGAHGEADFIRWTQLAGTVAGRDTAAQALVDRFERERARQEARWAALPDAARPRVLQLMSIEPLRALAGGSAIDQAIRHAGGRNVAAGLSRFGTIAFEQVLAWDPDVILLSGWPEEKTVPADLFASAQWSVLRAVREKRVYKVPLGGQRFDGIVEAPLYWQWLAELLHPERSEPRFRDLFRSIYRDTYQLELSDERIDTAIYAQANRESAGFGRLVER